MFFISLILKLKCKTFINATKKISRGEETEKLKQNLLYLESLINKLLFEMNSDEYLITNDCKELRRQIQYRRESRGN